jgi:hypothetical protein
MIRIREAAAGLTIQSERDEPFKVLFDNMGFTVPPNGLWPEGEVTNPGKVNEIAVYNVERVVNKKGKVEERFDGRIAFRNIFKVNRKDVLRYQDKKRKGMAGQPPTPTEIRLTAESIVGQILKRASESGGGIYLVTGNPTVDAASKRAETEKWVQHKRVVCERIRDDYYSMVQSFKMAPANAGKIVPAPSQKQKAAMKWLDQVEVSETGQSDYVCKLCHNQYDEHQDMETHLRVAHPGSEVTAEDCYTGLTGEEAHEADIPDEPTPEHPAEEQRTKRPYVRKAKP